MAGTIASWCRAVAAAVVLTAATAVSAAAVPLDDVVARGVVRIAVYRDFPPFSYREDGVLKGADVDLGKAIGEKLGLRVDFMELTADETMDDDLRNAVWKGPILGGGVADIMMHVPVNRTFAQRNDLVVIFGAYQRETYAVARDPARVSETAGFPVFQTEKVGVEHGALALDVKQDMIDELDAVVARLYGLNEDQLTHLFETFHEGWDHEPRLAAVMAHFKRLAA